MASPPAIGIDLGTTFSCVAVFQNGQVRIIPNSEDGLETTPSYVFIDSDGDEVIGGPAKQNAFKHPENTIFDVKRILGRKFKDQDLQNDMKFWPFTVQEHEGVPKVNVNGKLLHPEEISAKVLAKLKSFAESFLQLKPGSIKKAVITVPAYFNDGQRQATIDAGELAGFEVVSILNEPTAAAIAYYSQQQKENKPKKILVFDLGGGTFDVAVLEMQQKKIDVLGVDGHTHLGGEDFDRKLMEHCVSSFKAKTGIDLLHGKDDPNQQVRTKVRRNLRRLQTYCENAKTYLTSGVKAKVSVDVMVNGEDLVVDITRQQFEDMNKQYFQETIDIVGYTLKELGLSKNDIDDIILVGGSTRIPKIQQFLTGYFGGKVLNKSIHPDQAVAQGAAIQAAMITEAKSLGGGGGLQLQLKHIQDVAPLAVGIGQFDGTLAVMVPRNMKLPTKASESFYTVNDYQTERCYRIYEGNDIDVATNNNLLGILKLADIPVAKAGEDRADMTMEIDEMGIIHVQVVCSRSGRSNSVVIMEHANRMTKQTKGRLLAEARMSRLELDG